MGRDIVYSPNKYRETEGMKVRSTPYWSQSLCPIPKERQTR